MTIWSGADLDLDAYLARIGYYGERVATLDALRALHRGHTTSIPFENLELMLGRSLPLDLESLTDKLIRSPRGGYCFEHQSLFAAALERFGFTFTALTGRVMLGSPTVRPATHALTLVELGAGERWLCDVGFGRGPLEPVPFVDGAEVDQDGWRLRLTQESLGWTLWQRSDVDGEVVWLDRHVFTLNPQYRIDWQVGNHYVSTSPRSPFTMRPFVQRYTVERHDTLDGTTWTTTSPDGSSVERAVGLDDVPELLAGTFDVVLSDDDSAGLVEWMRLRVDG
ncbi:MAG: arylamine N-acetyltransferase [Gordonia sp. (in: high G+C Gram-positive bacteria)]